MTDVSNRLQIWLVSPLGVGGSDERPERANQRFGVEGRLWELLRLHSATLEDLYLYFADVDVRQ